MKVARKKNTKDNKEEGDREITTHTVNEDLDLVKKICLQRDFLIRMSNNLHFKLTVKDCLVKVTYITNDKTDYRIGVIQGTLLQFLMI